MTKATWFIEEPVLRIIAPLSFGAMLVVRGASYYNVIEYVASLFAIGGIIICMILCTLIWGRYRKSRGIPTPSPHHFNEFPDVPWLCLLMPWFMFAACGTIGAIICWALLWWPGIELSMIVMTFGIVMFINSAVIKIIETHKRQHKR